MQSNLAKSIKLISELKINISYNNKFDWMFSCTLLYVINLSQIKLYYHVVID